LAKATTAVAEKPTAGTAVVDAGEYAGYEADSGLGTENQSSSDWTIPLLQINQPTSKEAKREDDSIKIGTILNRTTGESYSGKEGIAFIPCFTKHTANRWTDINKGGGYKGEFDLNDPEVVRAKNAAQKFGKWHVEGTDDDFVETFTVYGVALVGEDIFAAAIPMASTNIKPYQNWMSGHKMLSIVTPNGKRITNLPLFAHRYRLTTARQERGEQTWYIWQVSYDGEDAKSCRLAYGSDLYDTAKGLHEAIKAGTAKLDTSGYDRGDMGDTGGQQRAASTTDEEPPF